MKLSNFYLFLLIVTPNVIWAQGITKYSNYQENIGVELKYGTGSFHDIQSPSITIDNKRLGGHQSSVDNGNHVSNNIGFTTYLNRSNGSYENEVDFSFLRMYSASGPRDNIDASLDQAVVHYRYLSLLDFASSRVKQVFLSLGARAAHDSYKNISEKHVLRSMAPLVGVSYRKANYKLGVEAYSALLSQFSYDSGEDSPIFFSNSVVSQSGLKMNAGYKLYKKSWVKIEGGFEQSKAQIESILPYDQSEIYLSEYQDRSAEVNLSKTFLNVSLLKQF